MTAMATTQPQLAFPKFQSIARKPDVCVWALFYTDVDSLTYQSTTAANVIYSSVKSTG